MNIPRVRALASRGQWTSTALLLVLLLVALHARAGTFTFSDYCNSEGKNCSIHYSGPIVQADVERLRSILKDAERRPNFNRHLQLNSEGGDLNAALELGKLIRSRELITFVLDECFSSCVIAFAGGVWRNVVVEAFGAPLARIGIHRPFSTRQTANVAERRQEFNTLAQNVKTFLREGGVSEALWDDMVKIPPESMRVLTQEDVINYGLFGKDPAYADYVDSEEARRFGISTAEYLRRKAMAKEICDSDLRVLQDRTGKSLVRCREDVLRGRIP